MGGQIGPDGYHRSRRNRQSNANRRRNGPLLNTESYSHIQVVAHPDANRSIRQEPQSPFIQNRSLQDEIYNLCEYEKNNSTATIASYPGFTPFSFAQVAASMSGPGQFANGNSRDITFEGDADADAATSVDQAPLQVTGPRRCTLKASKKKPKKWCPFDLGGSEGEFDTDDTRAAIPKTDNPVPELPTSVQETSLTPTAESQQYTNQLQESSPTRSITSQERRDSLFGICNTNYQSATDIAFNAAFPQLRNTPANSLLERSIIHKEDPEHTKLRLEHIMARIDDAFDVEEWDPDLPTGNSNNSPEQLTAEPQKITYTTVGSVAKTEAVTTFTAPVRIQREGSGRRLTAIPTPRGTDNYYNRNQQPGNNPAPNYGPPTNMRNPRYPQQQHAPPFPLDLAELEDLNLTDLEKEVLNSINATAAGAPSNEQGLQVASAPSVPANDAASGNFSVQKMLQEENSRTSAHLTGSSTFAGLNKMQTLQRLAQFDNPAQVFAKGRLAEFKAVKMKQQSEMAASGATAASQPHSFEHDNKTGMLQFGDTGSDPYKNATLAYSSQYPGQENGNPLQPSYNSFGREYPMNGYGAKAQLAAPPGYPQPLTAGPPRQGENSVAFNRLAWNSGYNQPADNPQQFQPPQVEKQYSPWNNTNGNFNQQARPFSSMGTGQSPIRDTLSLEEMSKYYPNGFGPNFQYGGELQELDEATRLSNLGLADDSLEAKQRRKAEKLDEWFYSGLSRLNMTTTDHIVELENRDKGIKPSAPRANMANRENLSVKEIRDKIDSECAKPLIDNLFGTLVAYSDNVMEPTNRRIMSKFVQSPAWALDTSEEGKKSIFGDNWVAPPKRLGRDPRYTRSKLSEGSLDYGGAGIAEALVSLGSYDGDGVNDLTGWPL
ncbi:hypothetical protein V493_02729 [Pseudogymnoascus sp. VKM F-4281 (FW-2241)]|nr:hypothetical protein V493_02729 [Pseudogymnoascus sp. VKM F-4281 (FW-2241)]